VLGTSPSDIFGYMFVFVSSLFDNYFYMGLCFT
jgi:hypothetical protein